MTMYPPPVRVDDRIGGIGLTISRKHLMRETTATPTTTSKTDPVAAQRTVARSIGLLTFSRMVFNIASRMTYPFLSVFAVGLGVDLHALSQVMVVRSATGFLSPFLASLADLWGHKRGVIIGTAICLLANLAVVLFPVYGVFFAAMSLTFLGMYFFMASMQAYVGEIVPFERRGMALAITETGWGLAFVVGMPVLGFLIRRWGWLSPFWLLTMRSACCCCGGCCQPEPNTPPAATRRRRQKRLCATCGRCSLREQRCICY